MAELTDEIRGRSLNYWKHNAEEHYMRVPIAVLKYISILEELAGLDEKCECCNGTGIVEGEHYDDLQPCLTCNGSGRFR